jgi:hypothetical protein
MLIFLLSDSMKFLFEIRPICSISLSLVGLVSFSYLLHASPSSRMSSESMTREVLCWARLEMRF